MSRFKILYSRIPLHLRFHSDAVLSVCMIDVVYHFHLGSHVERKQTLQSGLCCPVNRSPDPALDVGSTATIP